MEESSEEVNSSVEEVSSEESAEIESSEISSEESSEEESSEEEGVNGGEQEGDNDLDWGTPQA